jgi:hypothetical protein
MNAVRSLDVGLYHVGIVDHDFAVSSTELQNRTVDGLCFLKARHLLRCDCARYDVIGEDCGQLALVFRLQQIVERARRQLGESIIRRGEGGKRTRTL